VLALFEVAQGRQTRVLVQPPGDDRAHARRRHEGAVDERPAPRVLVGVGVVVDGARVERPDDAVMEHHVGHGDQERHPVLVQGEDHDDHEEVEVRLDHPARRVDGDRRGGHAAQRDPRGAPAPARARHAQHGAGHDPADVKRGVAGAVAAQHRVDGEPRGLSPEEPEHRPVPALP
jgi:hypothetical protein